MRAENANPLETTPTGILHSNNKGWYLATALIACMGLYVFSYQFQHLWWVWRHEPLRSIGMLIPPVSLWLALRSWRAEHWQKGGSWWGLVIMVIAMIMGMIASLSTPSIRILPEHFAIMPLLPTAFPICIYVSGVVVLLGGGRAWRAAWFPLLLLALMQPVPHFFQSLVDLPLQQIAAHAARAFAALIGVPVSKGVLKMMFAPHLGMYIAPGCNGLRGAVTMGLLALVAGHLYRMRWGHWALYTIGAVLLAYIFNFIRLSLVVVYYWLALHIPIIGNYGTGVDYAIGGSLFLVASFFLLGFGRRWRQTCNS